MQYYGISTKDVTFITSGNPISRLAALNNGSIQVTASTNYQRDQSLQVGNVLLKAEDSPVKYPTQVLVATDDLVKNHKPLLKKFLAAMSEATAWMRANQAAAAADCAKLTGATVEACASAIAFQLNPAVNSPYTWSSTLAVNVDGVKSALAVMAMVDPATKNVTVDDIVDTSIAGTTP
jgi:ABC-type nitrate/sulfonate/bicarbonate transport system substrate-binding protein